MKNEAIAHDASAEEAWGRPLRRFRRRPSSARAFYRVLLEYGELRADPTRVLEDHEVARLLDRIPTTTPLELRDRAMFEIACGCGLRAEELAGLDLRSIDFESRHLRVPAKGSAPRLVAAGEPALRSVARYLERGRAALVGDSGEPALFLSKSGRRLSGSDIRRRLRVWARHAAAQGTARERLGPSAISTTQVYTRVESARLRAAYERSHPRA